MLKIYKQYLIKKFLIKYLKICLIFFLLTILLGILEEISFVNGTNKANIILPYYLTLLNTPMTLFEIFPFIFLLTTIFLFYDLFKKEEIILLKNNGLSNIKIINTLLIISILVGLFNIVFYYNFSSKLKFIYSNTKNNLSNDNKYLAMVLDSGIWIKDEIDNKKFIIKSKLINDNYLYDTIINEFNSKFELLKTVQSKKINIENNNWIIYDPIITINNIKDITKKEVIFNSNFNSKKIYSTFNDITTLNISQLFELKNDFKKLGYSSAKVDILLLRLVSSPIFYSLLTLLSALLMFYMKKGRSLLFYIIIGITLSVMIYYINFMFYSLGEAGKIPPLISAVFPLILIMVFSLIGLIKINEK